MRERADNVANVGRVSTRQTTPAHGDVGLRDEAANPTYGGMAGEWKSVPLSTIATVKSGKRLPLGKALVAERTSHPYVRLVDIDNNRIRRGSMQYLEPSTHKAICKYIVRNGDVCLAIVGHTIGLVFQVDEQWDGANLTENAARLTDFRGADPTFVFNYLRSQVGQELIKSRTVGSAQGKLPLYAIADLPICLPPFPEQKAIAHILGTLDDKIELNRRMNATLEAMARALFQSWFVDFDPVRRNIDRADDSGVTRRRGERGGEALQEGCLTPRLRASAPPRDPNDALFPAHFQDSPLGHIPQGWKAGTLSEGFDLTMGQSPPGDTYNEDGNGIPFYQGRTDFGFRFPTHRIYCTAPTRYAKPSDTLVSVRAPVGDINMTDEECCIGRGVAAVRHNSGAISFTYYAMANLYPDFALFEGEGTVFGSINKQNFENLRFVIPPPEIVAAYEQLAKPLDDQIRTLEQQSRTLATLRDSLLPKLLSGELSVSKRIAEVTT